ncbi:MAG TPA: DUF1326 domain-containing protein [Anaeromyxobacteraceae bacterium]|nr:DUF1326 domain-containing protein [Anaeromyxobacteraceae bacterium]
MAWEVRGTYLESCSCEAICPCIVLGPPTEGDCRALVAWQIDEGRDGGVKLDGLRMALLVHTPGKMHETKWKAAVYVDSRADARQRESLLRIFGGKAGGHPAALASQIGELVGVKDAAITFEKKGKGYAVRIPGAVETDLEPLVGPDGGDVAVSNHLLAIAPGFPAVVGRASRSRITDHGWDWNLDGRQCMHSPFRYQG